MAHLGRLHSIPILVPLAIALTGCADAEPDDVDPSDDIELGDDELTPADIAAIEARVVARLPVGDLGRIDIVDAGIDGEPWYVTISVGGEGVHDVLAQLDRQRATPAEVFLAVAAPELALPDALVHDHEHRAARGEASTDGPRGLEYTVFRAETINHDCYSGHDLDPQSFASWIDEFATWSSGYVNWATHSQFSTTAEGTTTYTTVANATRAMSACDASYSSNPSNNLEVRFVGQPGGHQIGVMFYIADDLGDFDAARFKSSGGPYVEYDMLVKQQGPTPRRAYVAYGRCNGSCV